jgi:hypothetical protein
MTEILTPLDEEVWLRSELLEAGHSDRDLRLLVRGGVLRRVRRGAYVEASAYDATDSGGRHRLLCRAVAKQSKTRLVVSHSSAVPFHDGPMWGLPLDDVHVTRPDGRAGRAEAGVRQHQGTILDGDIVVRRGLEVMSATRSALQLTTCVGTETSLVVVNDFLHRRLTTIDALRERYLPMAQDPFTLKTDLVLRLADRRIESVGESRTFFMCFRGGVPAPTPQWELRDSNADLVARVDFAWPDLGVWMEFDGREKYVKHLREGESVVDAVLREKGRESMIAELTGWRCIRITWADLDRPAATVARISRVLGVATRSPRVTW